LPCVGLVDAAAAVVPEAREVTLALALVLDGVSGLTLVGVALAGLGVTTEGAVGVGSTLDGADVETALEELDDSDVDTTTVSVDVAVTPVEPLDVEEEDGGLPMVMFVMVNFGDAFPLSPKRTRM